MAMWIFIFAAVLMMVAVGVIYLISRLCKTEVIKKFSKENKHIQRLISIGTVIVFSGVCYFIFGGINMAVIIVHLLCIWIFADLVYLVISKRFKKNIKYNWIPLIVCIVLAVYFGYGWYEAHHVVATNYTLESPKIDTSLRLIQITDSHVGATFDGDGFADEIHKIQNENPDIVVITGDFVDDSTTKADMIKSCEVLGTLKTTYGVYFVFGNHDKGFRSEVRGYDAEELIQNLESNGVVVLQDEHILIGEDCYLIGRQDRSEESFERNRASMDTLIQDLDKDKYMIVLDHQPNDYDAQEKSDVDLVLSGHTHGGQFLPINRFGEWIGANDMTYGMSQRGSTNFEVSSGISDWELKFKTGCKSEYVVIDIEPKI